MVKQNSIKAVIFDFDGTLVDLDFGMDKDEEKAKFKEIEGASNVLNALKKQGKQVAIISLNGEKVIRNIIIKLGLPYIKIVVGRDTTDFVKPDPKVGEYVLNKLKLKPEEVLLVGDSDYDIQLANKLKIKSLWFKNKSTLRLSKPTYKIKKLQELLDYIPI